MSAEDCVCDRGFTKVTTSGVCQNCAAGKFKNQSGTHSCRSCPRHHVSLLDGTGCQCNDEYRGTGCMIRRRPPPSVGDRSFRLRVALLVNASVHPPSFHPELQKQLSVYIADFFSLKPPENFTFGSLQMYRRQSGNTMYITDGETRFSANWKDFFQELPDTMSSLDQVLGSGGESLIRVASISVTCGRGQVSITNQSHVTKVRYKIL